LQQYTETLEKKIRTGTTWKELLSLDPKSFALPAPPWEDREKRTFALLLYYSGCRISEGLFTTYKKVDYVSFISFFPEVDFQKFGGFDA
jgi:hypothetical protein